MNHNKGIKNLKRRIPTAKQTPTIANQPSEAGSHFMFEFAKMLLSRAGVTETSTFVPPNYRPENGEPPHTPHRALHLCAFRVGLYALGLHNCVSANWMSRTYCSLASWINSQALEIGCGAINALICDWEGNLTPHEVAMLADGASRSLDTSVVDSAATLTLAALKHAHALNPVEIQRALIQCGEFSRDMLQVACAVVEAASKNGAVYPEVLFDISRRWFTLYKQSVDSGNSQQNSAPMLLGTLPSAYYSRHHRQSGHENMAAETQRLTDTLLRGVQPPFGVYGAARTPPTYHAPMQRYLSYQKYMTMNIHPMGPRSQANSIFQSMYTAPPPQVVQSQAPPPLSASQPLQSGSASQLHYPNIAYRSYSAPLPMQPMQGSNAMLPQVSPVTSAVAQLPPSSSSPSSTSSAQSATGSLVNCEQFLLNCYRVAMMAMEALLKRSGCQDDRSNPAAKYQRLQPDESDILWTMSISKKLGATQLLHFCTFAAHACFSPFLLYDLAVESALFMQSATPTCPPGSSFHLQIQQHPQIMALLQRSIQMFRSTTYQRLNHISSSEYEEFVHLVLCARKAFYCAPNGHGLFNEYLNSLRRSKDCSKSLYQMIVSQFQQL